MAKSAGGIERVRTALAEKGVEARFERFDASTRTAEQAARAVGCDVGQIAKSLVFQGADSGEAILVITSGRNRVDLKKAASAAGEPLEMADPAFVRERTGFAIGGVPPLGHARPLKVFVDRDLLEFDTIWAAAGTPDGVFALSPEQLLAVTGGSPVDVS